MLAQEANMENFYYRDHVYNVMVIIPWHYSNVSNIT